MCSGAFVLSIEVSKLTVSTIFYIQVHLSNKVLMCRICEKDFATPRELMTHMKGNHHACEMPYVCHLCNFRSSMYSDVVDHFKKVNGNNIINDARNIIVSKEHHPFYVPV